MKQLYGKLWVKCTAIALLVVFAVLFAAAALGSAYLIRYGAFADGGEQVRQMAETIFAADERRRLDSNARMGRGRYGHGRSSPRTL